jgi:hypothetical protein
VLSRDLPLPGTLDASSYGFPRPYDLRLAAAHWLIGAGVSAQRGAVCLGVWPEPALPPRRLVLSRGQPTRGWFVGSMQQLSNSRLHPAAVLQGSSASSSEFSTAALFLFATDCSCGACCF